MKRAADPQFFIQVRGFLTVYLPRQKCLSPHTIKAYRDTLNLLRQFLRDQKQIPFTAITFDQLDHVVIEEFLAWLGSARQCRASTRNHRLAALRSFFHYAALQEPALMAAYAELQKVPAAKVVVPPVEYLSDKALQVLLAQPNAHTHRGLRDQFLLVLLYDTAARIHEVLNLRLKDFNLDVPVPFVYLNGKGHKIRAVPLLSKTVDHLDYYLHNFHPEATRSDQDFLFYTVIHGQTHRLSEDTAAYWLTQYGAMAREICPEVPSRVHPHLLRHTRAMHLYQAGMPLTYIKDFLGHAQLHTTDRYAFADTTMMREALEKAVQQSPTGITEQPIWQNNEELILKLCGLQ